MNSYKREDIKTKVLEIYIPKKLDYLSELYKFLTDQIKLNSKVLLLSGFSIYEVDGAYTGQKVYEERILVVRIIYNQSDDISLKIDELANEIIKICQKKEEEIWLLQYEAKNYKYVRR